MSKCILLIDMDGVVADWMEGLRSKFELENPGLKMAQASEFEEYHVRNKHPEWYDKVSSAMHTKGLYSSLPVMPGAVEALKDIEQNCLDFIDPFLCSSPETEYEDQLCFSEKASWVDKHLGRFWTEKLILTRDKTLVRGHILVDDKPTITGAMNPTWEHLVYKQSWNAEHGDLRFSWSDWSEFRDLALKPIYKKSILLNASGQPQSFSKNIITGNLYAR